MARRPLLTAVAFFAAPAFIYAVIATRGTLDLLRPDFGWVFYNQYALALIEGRLSLPVEAIGQEGIFLNGRVYAYYGVLPAILRLPLAPFLDLRQTPLAVLLNWAMCAGGAMALQAAALDAWRWRRRKAPEPGGRLEVLILASLCIWFFSGLMLTVQNASFYHEPFAAALLATGLFTLISVRVLLFRDGAPSAVQILGMAACAAACVFARQTMAISLYAGTLAWIAVSGFRTWAGPGGVGRLLPWGVRSAALPLLLMLAAGVAYLVLNQARFGSLGGFPIERYGFLLVDPGDARLANIRDEGQFNLARVIPNAVFALIGGDELRQSLIGFFGGGRTEAMGAVVRLAVAWPASFLLAGLTMVWLVRHAKRERLARLSLLIAGCLSLGAILQLAYATAQYRYHAELWPPFGLLVALSVAFADKALAGARARAGAAWVCGAAAAVSAVYVTEFSIRGLTEGSYFYKPLPPILADLASAPGARDPTLPGRVGQR